mmetsp:Transcript_9445/g.14159  ORF Transcript_9445/g.14159 Transcript_9445/m.14159 type:complete len:856 (-) Transcript_9445:184-2751(-)
MKRGREKEAEVRESILSKFEQRKRLLNEKRSGLESKARLFTAANDHKAALELWEELLLLNPLNPEVLNQKGMCLMRIGRNQEALKVYEKAISINPKHWGAHNNKGVVLKEMGYLRSAIQAYHRAMEYTPDKAIVKHNIAMALTNLGTELKIAGHEQAALKHYREAIVYDSEFAPAHFDIGVILSNMGLYREAFKAYHKALESNPGNMQALCNIGVLYKNLNNVNLAIKYYERALQIDPNFEIARSNAAIAYTDMGTRQKNAGNIQVGMKWYKKALVMNPKYSDAWYNLGVAHAALGQSKEAIVNYEIATTFNPRCVEAFNNQGVIYKELGNLQKSIQCYKKALAVNPAFALTLNNLGVIYTSLGKLDEAYKYCVRAVQANPHYAEAYNNLGVLFRDEGNMKLAINSYDRSLKIDPNSKNAGQNRLLAMNSLTREDLDFEVSSLTDYIYEEHCKWSKRFQAPYKPFTTWSNDRKADRILRIGYISADFFTHSVSYFIELPLKLADKKRVCNVCYSNVARKDSRTELFTKYAQKWVDIYGRDAKEVAEIIRKDKIDILVELTGHTAGNRLDIMALKPAPVQITWIGYPNTTGVTTIDYRFCDSKVDPVDTKQKFTEKLIRLPNTFLCYSPPVEAPAVSPTPALQNGFITFGSFNNFAKINDHVLDLWCHILKRVPGSCLLMKCKPFACPKMKTKALERIKRRGIDSRRVFLFPLFPTTKEHLSLYSFVDISIDTFPYAGTTTTCEAMYMGIPVITLRSQKEDNHAHNVSCSLVSNVPFLRKLVTNTPQEYADAAVNLANDVKALQGIRETLRAAMLKSPLCDGPKFVNNLEFKYKELWEKFCREKNQIQNIRKVPER